MKILGKCFISVFIIVCLCLTMMIGMVSYAEEPDYYYWNYEETLNEVGGRMDLVSKIAVGADVSENDAFYYDGVIEGTYALDLFDKAHAVYETLNTTITSFTFASWVNLPSDYPRDSAYTSLISVGTYTAPESFFQVYFEEANEEFKASMSIGNQHLTGEGCELEADEWYHVAITYDGTTKTAKIYINGECKVDTVVSATPFTGITEGATLYIGHQIGQWLFTGTIVDESVFATSVWSADQIKALYDDPAAAAASMTAVLDPDGSSKPTEPPATTAPATTAPETAAPATTVPATTAPATTAPATTVPATTKAPVTSADPGADDSDGSMLPIIITAIVAVVVIGVVIVVIIVKKKKK